MPGGSGVTALSLWIESSLGCLADAPSDVDEIALDLEEHQNTARPGAGAHRTDAAAEKTGFESAPRFLVALKARNTKTGAARD
jgi:hypothetical protein